MKRFLQPEIITTGLAFFSMLFGAGNLIYPLQVGMLAGDKTLIAMAAFLITSVLLPLVGLLAMILFDGDYTAFFARLGRTGGKLVIAACMLIIGPALVIPRIVTLSHVIMTPFLPAFLSEINLQTSFIFALLFLTITFLCTFRESKIVSLLGTVISPALLISLAIIIIAGFFRQGSLITNHHSYLHTIKQSLLVGYETLDLLGAIFFSSIVIVILKKSLGHSFEKNRSARLLFGLKAGLIGVGLLSIVYCGMAFLGAYYGHGLGSINAGLLFREVSLRVLGSRAAIIIAVAVLMACLSTAIALSAVCAEYVQRHILQNKTDYISSLTLVLLACIPLSTFGLSKVLQITGGPLTFIGYPVVIALTLCNIAYKLVGFRFVKIPVVITFLVTTLLYYW